MGKVENSGFKIEGKWIILLNDHIIGSGNNIKELFTQAEKKHPRHKLVLARVPEEGTMIY